MIADWADFDIGDRKKKWTAIITFPLPYPRDAKDDHPRTSPLGMSQACPNGTHD